MLDKGPISLRGYTSCIKIDGEPILPPLITDVYRAELLNYRDRATAIEQRLRQKTPQTTRGGGGCPTQLILQQQQSSLFNESGYGTSAVGSKTPVTEASSTRTATPSLSSCLLDVAEFSDDGCRVVYHNGCVAYSDPDSEHVSVMDSDSAASVREPPKLIRSGSYTLDTPSPVLLAHLQKQSRSIVLRLETEAPTTSTAVESAASYMSSPKESEKNTIVTSPMISQRTSPTESERTRTIVVTPVAHSSSSISEHSKALTTSQTNSPKESDKYSSALTHMSSSSISDQSSYDEEVFLDSMFKSFDSNETKLHIAKTRLMPDQSQDIDCTNIVGDIRSRMKDIVVTVDESDKDYSSSKLDGAKKVDGQAGSPRAISERLDERTSISQSQNRKLEQSVPCTEIASTPLEHEHTKKLNRLLETANVVYSVQERAAHVNAMTVVYHRVSESMTGTQMYHSNEPDMASHRITSIKSVVGLETYHTDETELMKYRAASKIQAGIRGYLVRRLMKTGRVQALIQTIRDAVLCAMQLHEVDELEEADVELHRRLIQQVSAACYAFHDVFFALDVCDQMAIIANDRKHLAEKAKRSIINSQ